MTLFFVLISVGMALTLIAVAAVAQALGMAVGAR